jgi:hypothetical protein
MRHRDGEIAQGPDQLRLYWPARRNGATGASLEECVASSLWRNPRYRALALFIVCGFVTSCTAACDGPGGEHQKKTFSIRFGSPQIPGGGAGRPPKSLSYKNEYRYSENVTITVEDSTWSVTHNTCHRLGPGEKCHFTLHYNGPHDGGAEVFAHVLTTCPDKSTAPCSALPFYANPTSGNPVIASWKDWLGRYQSQDPE